MVLVKNLVNYFYYILSIKAAKCNPFLQTFYPRLLLLLYQTLSLRTRAKTLKLFKILLK